MTLDSANFIEVAVDNTALTYRRAKLLKGGFHKGHVLGEHSIQVPATLIDITWD